MRRGNKPGLADERRLHLLLEARSCCRPRAAAPMSVAHTPSRYDPCTTGTDGTSLGARPCGGSDVEASPRQSCAARRLSVSNPGPLTSERYALHLGPALPTEWCYRVVWWSGALELLQRRLRTARIVQRTPHQPSCLRVGIVCFGPHQPGACVRRTFCRAPGQERCRAKRRCQRGRRVASLLACAPRLTRLW